MAQVGAVRLSGPLGLAMDVAMAVPASWGRTKRLAALAGALRPVVKPDVDNMLKLVADALNGVIWIDDAQVVDARVTKRYAAEGSTVLTVWTITGEAP